MKIKKVGGKNLFEFLTDENITKGFDTKENLLRYKEQFEAKLLDVNFKLQLINNMTEGQVEISGAPDFKPEKRFQIKATEKDYIRLVNLEPKMGIYRKENNIQLFEFENYIFFYVDFFNEGHKELLESVLGVNAITDRGV